MIAEIQKEVTQHVSQGSYDAFDNKKLTNNG
jgi:hypothetical protein